MWIPEYPIKSNEIKSKIFYLWTDVINRKKSVVYSYLNGPFKNGTCGSFKTRIGFVEKYYYFAIRQLTSSESFTCRVILLFLCFMVLGFEMFENDNILIAGHNIKFYGLFQFFHKKLTVSHISSFYKNLRLS
jgi:hypothetical protein